MVVETKVKVGGAWKDLVGVQIKVAGAWKDVDTIEAKVAAAWKTVLESGPADEPIDITIQHAAGKGFHLNGFVNPTWGAASPTTVGGHVIDSAHDDVQNSLFRFGLRADLAQSFFDKLEIENDAIPTIITLNSSAATHNSGPTLTTWTWAAHPVDWEAEGATGGVVREMNVVF